MSTAAFSSETREALESEGRLWMLSRALAHGAGAWAFLAPLAGGASVWAGVVGAFAGALLGGRLARVRLRTWSLATASVLLLAALATLRHGAGASLPFASLLGPGAGLGALEFSTFLVGGAIVSSTLRALALRHRVLGLLEVAAATLAVAAYFAPHRDGAINRPFELADPILTRGGDPTVAILIAGGVAVGLGAVLFLRERRVLRAVVHLLVLALVVFGVVWTTSTKGLPTPPPPTDGLGLRGDENRGGGQGGGSGGASNGELEFRDDSSSSQKQVPVAVVIFRDDYSPPTGMYYFRQGAFSQYNGSRLVAATRDDVDRDLFTSFPNGTVPSLDPPGDGGSSESVETSVALLADHPQPFALTSAYEMTSATNPDSARFRRVYRVRSRAIVADYPIFLGHESASSAWSPEVRAHYTKAPTDPRYAALATEIIGAVPEGLRGEAIVRAVAVSEWLGKNSKYSLRSRHADAPDPTADYLFGDRVGYCVHFAHAGVYLMRSLGLAARVATGYAVEESARQGGSTLLITGGASHAWPEVYLDGVGWVVVDVAPEESLDPPPPPPDPDLQRLLGELARGDTPVPEDGSPPPRSFDELARRLSAFALRGGLLALVLLLLAGYGTKIWRAIAPRFARPDELGRLLYRAELDALSAVGARRRAGESREAFAERFRDALPSLVPFTNEHLARTFGRGTDGTKMRDAAKTLRTERKRFAKAWRRALGALNPLSWIWTR